MLLKKENVRLFVYLGALCFNDDQIRVCACVCVWCQQRILFTLNVNMPSACFVEAHISHLLMSVQEITVTHVQLWTSATVDITHCCLRAHPDDCEAAVYFCPCRLLGPISAHSHLLAYIKGAFLHLS